MTSRLVDRPCGVGFLDLTGYAKFLTCGVDDSRDVLNGADEDVVEFHASTASTPAVQTLPPEISTSDEDRDDPAKKAPPEGEDKKKTTTNMPSPTTTTT